MWSSLPELGTASLYAVLVATAYTFAMAVLSAGSQARPFGSPRLLSAARMGAHGTSALVAFAVLLLAHAFVSNDFRVSYVSRYSDRSMSTTELFTALWGGQDGSLLWWLFLSATFTSVCVVWLKGKYHQLQPYVIATLMTVLAFFAILMIFSANPFATHVAGAPEDGTGLNYQLRNFYMIIHPPSLYVGFTSSAIPFAFAIAALVSGRLDSEWIVASRKWMLFSWLFLSIGNALGMLWAYEELGWGGYWAWDPVENAAFLPWITASAYVHSTMIQERRGLFRVWNVVLIVMTFFLTIFGTFLTRSGLIASVHSFAQSGIGSFFLYFMGFIVCVSGALIVYRWRELKSTGSLDSVLSRETAFLLNNWGFVSLMVFIALATIWPRISEWLLNEEATLGPTFYNTWIPPLALLIFALMGVAPLLGWRKTSPELFWRSFRIPTAAMLLTMIAHASLGHRFGYPAVIQITPIYSGALGTALSTMLGVFPVITVGLVVFNIVVVAQEFARGTQARIKAHGESVGIALARLVAKSRRRYGGYIVHMGIAAMFFGFTGRSWEINQEASLKPGETVNVGQYALTYQGPRMEVDAQKRMIFADLAVTRGGEDLGALHPAKFIYKSAPDQPSTEVAKLVTLQNDLYVIVGIVNAQTKVASFQIHVNPFVSFIWLGVIILILGASLSLWPELGVEPVGAMSYLKTAGAVTSMTALSILMAWAPAQALHRPSLPAAGTVQSVPQDVSP